MVANTLVSGGTAMREGSGLDVALGHNSTIYVSGEGGDVMWFPLNEVSYIGARPAQSAQTAHLLFQLHIIATQRREAVTTMNPMRGTDIHPTQ